MVAFPGSVVRLEDCQGAAVAQFPERPHCHVSLSQRTLTAIDQRGQAPDSITAETCGGTVTSRARVKPDDAFQYEQGDGNRKNACQGPQYPTLPLQGVHDVDNRPCQFPGQASLNGRSCDFGTEDDSGKYRAGPASPPSVSGKPTFLALLSAGGRHSLRVRLAEASESLNRERPRTLCPAIRAAGGSASLRLRSSRPHPAFRGSGNARWCRRSWRYWGRFIRRRMSWKRGVLRKVSNSRHTPTETMFPSRASRPFSSHARAWA
jgi:hypothetical protein